MKKRRRRRYGKYRMRYRFRRKRYAKRVGRAEVKLRTIHAVDQSIREYVGSSIADMYSPFNFQQDVIANITKGTNGNERIGDHIFVKKIVFDFWGDLCPKVWNTPATNIDCNSILHRTLIGNWRNSGDVSGIWRNAVAYQIHGQVDRRAYNVHLDRLQQITVGIPASQKSSAAVTGMGKTWHKQMVLNLNRQVTFDANTGKMKRDEDVVSLAMLGHLPSPAPSTWYQTACMCYRIRIYYTDN